MKIGPKHHVSVGEVTPPKGKHKEISSATLAALKIFTTGVNSLKGHIALKKPSKEDRATTQLAQSTTQKVPSPFIKR